MPKRYKRFIKSKWRLVLKYKKGIGIFNHTIKLKSDIVTSIIGTLEFSTSVTL